MATVCLLAWQTPLVKQMESTDRATVQRQTLRALMTTQVLVGGTTASAVTVGALMAKDLTGSDILAGVSAASITLGAATAALPLATAASKRGRRPVLVVAFVLGFCGSLLVAVAAAAEVYVLLVVGLLLVGWAQAGSLQTRFAAGDLALDEERGRAIGLVLWATTIGAVSAPSLLGATSWLADKAGTAELAGSPLMGAAFAAGAALFVHRRLRPDPLVISGGITTNPQQRSVKSGLTQLAGNHNARLGVAAVVTGHVVMVAIMAMTALHLDEGGQPKTVIGFVFSVHIAGMFAFSPVSGWLTDRVGRLWSIGAGSLLLTFAAQTASHTAGGETGMMFLALFSLGFGWSLCLVAGSALLSESVPKSERVNVQGLSDLSMSGFGAVAAVAAGVAKAAVGFSSLALAVMILAILLAVATCLRWVHLGKPKPGVSFSH